MFIDGCVCFTGFAFSVFCIVLSWCVICFADVLLTIVEFACGWLVLLLLLVFVDFDFDWLGAPGLLVARDLRWFRL